MQAVNTFLLKGFIEEYKNDIIVLGMLRKGLSPIECLKRAEIFAAYKIGFDGASLGFADEETVEKMMADNFIWK